MNKKKLAFVDLTNYVDWPVGGMLEYEKSILPYLAEHYDIDIWGCSVDNIYKKSLDINGKTYPIHIFGNVSKHHNIIPNYWKGLTLLRFKKNFKKYDIIYGHTGSCITALTFIANKKSTMVYHQHGLSYLTNHTLMSYSQKPFYYIAQVKSDVVFYVTDRESFENFCKTKKRTNGYYYLGSPIHLEKFNNDKIAERLNLWNIKKSLDFIYVGRLDIWKNVELLVDAFALYLKDSPQSIFRIIGGGDHYDIIQGKIQKYNISKNVIMYGSLEHSLIYDYLEKSDVFLISSKGEGVSISVLEAYSAGLPVICGTVPGLAKQVINKKTGLHAKYSAQGFCDMMKSISQNYMDLATNCLEEAKKYSANKISNFIINKIDLNCK